MEAILSGERWIKRMITLMPGFVLKDIDNLTTTNHTKIGVQFINL